MCQDTLAERLRKARERATLTQVAVAKRLEITSASISNWEQGRNEPERDKLIQLSREYRVNPLWLTWGIGDIENELGTDSVGFRSHRGRPVPRLELQTAVLERFIQEVPVVDFHTYFDCGPRSFVVEIKDKSNAPGFSAGDAVVIDPDEQPMPGDWVLAALKPDNRPVFRRYEERRGENGEDFVALIPGNSAWKTEFIRDHEDGRIVGVMTEHVTPRR
jgi:transcriptional regulator with XRE-family HTH domain